MKSVLRASVLSCAFLSGAFLILAGCGHHSLADTHEHIALDQTPQAVMDGFRREFPGLKVSHVDRITALGNNVSYEVKFRDAKNDYKRILFSADGKLEDSKWDVALPATMPAK